MGQIEPTEFLFVTGFHISDHSFKLKHYLNIRLMGSVRGDKEVNNELLLFMWQAGIDFKCKFCYVRLCCGKWFLL